jgi:hypothetical protein
MAITASDFNQRLCHLSALKLVSKLGQLGQYVLNNDVLSLAGKSTKRSPMPIDVGCNWPILAIQNPSWRQFTLPAIVLPLQWTSQKDGIHDRRLPPGIVRVAREVQAAFGDKYAEFELGFVDQHQRWPDLSQLTESHLTADSCLVSLAMGLHSARVGIPPNNSVWASASWDSQFRKVDCLEEKLSTAQRFGAKYFFTAESNVAAINATIEAVCNGVHILPIRPNALGGLMTSLAECFSYSLLEPDSSDWASCQRYHKSIVPLDNRKANEFYDRVLFRHIIELCQKSIRRSPSAVASQPTHLVTIATRATQPVKVIAQSLEVQSVLVLFTDGMECEAESLQAELKKLIPHGSIQTASFSYDTTAPDFPTSFRHCLSQPIQSFCSDVAPERIVFDIDRGTTLHKIALLKYIIQPQNLLATLLHKQNANNQIDHGEEQILLWYAGDSWQQPFEKA